MLYCMHNMKQTFTKITTTLAIIALFFLYGAVVVFAVPPVSQYAPAEILDPACLPGDINCSVTTGWQFDTVDGHLFNTTDQIGIGVDPDSLIAPYDTAVLATDGVSIMNNEYAPDKVITSAVGDGNLIMGHHDGTFYGNTGLDTSIVLTETAWGGGVTDFLNGTGGGASFRLRNEMADGPLGDGINSILQVGANPTTALRYGLLMYTGGQWNEISLTEYNPVLDLNQKTFRIDNSKIFTEYLYNIVDEDNYDYHYADISDSGYVWEFESDRATYTAQSIMRLDNTLSFSTEVGGTNTLFEVAADGAIYSDTLEGGSTTLSVDAGGNIIRTPSDEKLKTNISSLDDSLERVMQLNPVTYTWKDQERFGDQIEIGFIAQEIEDIVPEVVRSGGEYKSVNYQVLTALNAGAIKELAQQLSDRAVKLIDDVREIFVRKVTTEELCIEDVCFDKDEARILKEIITDGGYEVGDFIDNNVDEEDVVDEPEVSEEEPNENQEPEEELNEGEEQEENIEEESESEEVIEETEEVVEEELNETENQEENIEEESESEEVVPEPEEVIEE